MTNVEWITAITNIATAIGTVGTLIWAVRIAKDSTKEKLRVQFFISEKRADIGRQDLIVNVNSLEFQIENLGAQKTIVVAGGLHIRQIDGSHRVLHANDLLPNRKGWRPLELIKILPGGVHNGRIPIVLEDISFWWTKRSRGSFPFDRPFLRLETARGTVFKYRLSEEIWKHLQTQDGWERYREKNHPSRGAPYYEEDDE